MKKITVGQVQVVVDEFPLGVDAAMEIFMFKKSGVNVTTYITHSGEETYVDKPGRQVVFDREKLHLLRLNEAEAQALSEALSAVGVKAPDTHRVEGELDATKLHLDDMRRLVFEPQIEQHIAMAVPEPPK